MWRVKRGSLRWHTNIPREILLEFLICKGNTVVSGFAEAWEKVATLCGCVNRWGDFGQQELKQ